jgi:hypothetical protein
MLLLHLHAILLILAVERAYVIAFGFVIAVIEHKALVALVHVSGPGGVDFMGSVVMSFIVKEKI